MDPVTGYVDLRSQPDSSSSEAGPQTAARAAPAGWTEAQREEAVQQRPVLVQAWQAHENQPVQSVQCTSSPAGIVTSGADGFAHLWDADGGKLGTLAMDPQGSVSRLGPWKWIVNVAQRHEERVVEARQALRMVEQLAAQRIIARWVRRFLAQRREKRGEVGGDGGAAPATGAVDPGRSPARAGNAAAPQQTPLPRELENARPQSVAAALDASPWRSTLGLGLEAQMLSSPSGPSARRATAAIRGALGPLSQSAKALAGQHARGLVQDVAQASLVELRAMRVAAGQWVKRQQARAEIEAAGQRPVSGSGPEAAQGLVSSGSSAAKATTAGLEGEEAVAEDPLADRIREARSKHVKQRRSRARMQRLERAWEERAWAVNDAEFRAQRRLGATSSTSARVARLPLEVDEQREDSDGEEDAAGGESKASTEPSDTGETVPTRPPVVLHVSHRSDAHPAFRLLGKSRPNHDARVSRVGTKQYALIPPSDRASAAQRSDVRGSQDVTFGDREQRTLPFTRPRPLPMETGMGDGADHVEPQDVTSDLGDEDTGRASGAATAPRARGRRPASSAKASGALPLRKGVTRSSASVGRLATAARGKPPLAGSKRRAANAGQRRAMRATLLTDEPPVPQFLQVFDRSPIAGEGGPGAHSEQELGERNATSARGERSEEAGPGQTLGGQGSGGVAMAQLKSSASAPSLRPGAGLTSQLATPAKAGTMEVRHKRVDGADVASSQSMANLHLDRDHPPALTLGEELMPDVARELHRLKAARMARIKGTDFGAPAGTRRKSALKHMRKALSAGRLSRRPHSPTGPRGENVGAHLAPSTSPLSATLDAKAGALGVLGATADGSHDHGATAAAQQDASPLQRGPVPRVDVARRDSGTPHAAAPEPRARDTPPGVVSAVQRRRRRTAGSRRVRRELAAEREGGSAPLGMVTGQGVQQRSLHAGSAQGAVGSGGSLQQAFLRRASTLAGERTRPRTLAGVPGDKARLELQGVDGRRLSVPTGSPVPAEMALDEAGLRGFAGAGREQ